ncbi:MAG: hypothetical protein VB736_00105 [Candidatus Nitrosopelagicus sp.]|jgi:hypothetical protein|tara:strand:- start:255 stop:386 length:132 start_codon:yes stop_codon:yes gene_type:complete
MSSSYKNSSTNISKEQEKQENLGKAMSIVGISILIVITLLKII